MTEGGSLRSATLAGVRWVAIARVVGESAGFGSAVVLARLISPAEFGHAAVALVLNVFAVVVLTDGLSAQVVQSQTVDRRHLGAAQLLSLASGLLLAGLTVAFAELVGASLFGERTAHMLLLVSPVFLLSALTVVPLALLQRELNFRRISVFEVTGRVTGVVVSLALAIAGMNAEALVLGAVATAATFAVLLLALGGTPWTAPRWHRDGARSLLAFGIPASFSSLLFSGVRNIDYAILAARVSASQIGFYYRAFQLAVEYPSKISAVMRRVAFPVYSRASLETIRALRVRITKVHAIVIFPLLGSLIVLAPQAIPFLFGEPWQPAVVPTQILAIAGMASTVNVGNGAIMLAVGKPRALLGQNIAFLGVYAVVLLLTVPHGLTAVCAGVAGTYVAMNISAHYFLLKRLVGIPFRQLFSDLAPAAVATIALMAVTTGVADLIGRADPPRIAILAPAGLLGLATYAAVLRLAFRSAWDDFILLVRGALNRPAAPRPRDPNLERPAAAAR